MMRRHGSAGDRTDQSSDSQRGGASFGWDHFGTIHEEGGGASLSQSSALTVAAVAASANISYPQQQQQQQQQDDVVNDDFLMATKRRIWRIKRAVLIFLILVGITVATMTYWLIQQAELKRYSSELENDTNRIVRSFYQKTANKLWVGLATSITYYSSFPEASVWPNVTLPNMEFSQSIGPLFLAESSHISFAPLLRTKTERKQWEAYAVANQGLTSNTVSGRAIEDGIFRFVGESSMPIDVDDNDENLPYLPIWQIAPAGYEGRYVMLDQRSEEDQAVQNAIRLMLQTKRAVLGGAHFHSGHFHDATGATRPQKDGPHSTLFVPVLDQLSLDGNVLGAVSLHFEWTSYFTDLVDGENHDLHVVLVSALGDAYTFLLQGPQSTFVGEGMDMVNQRDSQAVLSFEQIRHEIYSQCSTFYYAFPNTFYADYTLPPYSASNDVFDAFSIKVYTTSNYQNVHLTYRPILYSVGVGVLFGLCVCMFVVYDRLVEKRQNMVLIRAQQSNEIVRSLFPPGVRKRLIRSNKHKLSMKSTREYGTQQNNRLFGSFTLHKYLHATLPASDPHDESGTFLLAHNIAERDPIVDMFPSTTIMFADISGFTAWSSEREPTQVFQLLETLYGAYDLLARRLGVFKVETIGDCYVAVAGLPEPNKDHAVVMARFAHECLCKMNELTRQMDVTLGPGTSDLRLRVGLHSGPVTAGVLRGDRARFQLFGDTVNTASRMESTGAKGKIQVSQVTANLLIVTGKRHWVKPREDLVHAKGKGTLKTFWLTPRPRTKGNSKNKKQAAFTVPKQSTLSKHIEDTRVLTSTPVSVESNWAELSIEDSTASHPVVVSRDDRVERLIDWNTDVLLGLLERVVKHRNAEAARRVYRTRGRGRSSKKIELSTGNNSTNNINAWSSGRPATSRNMSDTDMSTTSTRDIDFSTTTTPSSQTKLVSSEVARQLRELVNRAASWHRDNAFHNFEHACHVTQAANKLVNSILASEHEFRTNSNRSLNPETENDDDTNSVNNANANPNSIVHNGAFRAVCADPLNHFTIVFAALFHDVDHRGVPNTQLAKECPELVARYGEESLAEKHALQTVHDLLHEPRFEELRACICRTQLQASRFYRLLDKAIIATDIRRSDLQASRQEVWSLLFGDNIDDAKLSYMSNNMLQDLCCTVVMEHVMQASDVAHTMQHWQIFCKWNERLFQECYANFLNGRTKEDPSITWYEDQIGFFDKFVIPLAQKLNECGLFGVQSQECYTYALENRTGWEHKGQEVTADFLRRAKALN